LYCTVLYTALLMSKQAVVKRIPVSFRVTPRFKHALELAAQREQRSQTNLVEKLVFDFCKKLGIDVDSDKTQAIAANKKA
jgi:hypothetical protein